MDIAGFIISFVSGAMVSLAIWFFTTKLLSPKMLLSDSISRTTTNGGMTRYYFKLQNSSSHRDIYDITCYARFHFSNDFFYSQTISPIPLLCCKDGKNECNSERKVELKKLNLSKTSTSVQKKYEEFAVARTVEIIRSEDDAETKGKTTEKKELLVNIDEFFKREGDNGYIEIIVICYDAFSGAKRCVLSKKFKSKDIHDGHFLKGAMKIENDDPESSIESHADSHS